MLKLLYKTLVVSLLSGSLLLLDFSYKGAIVQFNSARAETLTTEGVGGNNMMATLTMTAVGLLASRLYRYKMTTDIMLAAAGGAAYIVGDILAVFKNKEVMKDLETQITRDEKGNIDQKQIETLEKLKKSYEAAMETANTKKMLQMAAAAAFAAAGISAYIMTATEETQQAQCLLGLQTASSAGYSADMGKCTAAFGMCTPACTGPHAAACLNACNAQLQLCNAGANACKAKIAADMSTMTSYISAREAPSPSAAGFSTTSSLASTIESSFPASAGPCTPYGSGQLAAENGGTCPLKAVNDVLDSSFGTSATLYAQFNQYPNIQKILFPKLERKIYAEAKENKSFMEKTLNFFIPEVRADLFSPMGIASGLAIKFILAANVSLATTLDLNLLIPKRRAIAWGILAALTYAASSSTDGEIGKIQSNIDKIDAILNKLYPLQNGVTTANVIAGSNQKIDKNIAKNPQLSLNSKNGSDIDLKAKGGEALPCITGDDPSKCPSFSDKLNAQADLKNMPEVAQQQIGNIAKMADGINGTSQLSASTLSQAQTVANQANAIRAELANRQKQVQAILKANGSSTDLAKDSAKLAANMRAVIQKELNKNKMTAGQMLAIFDKNSTIGLTNETKATPDANQNAISAKKAAGGGAGTITLGAGAVSLPKVTKDEEALLKEKKEAEDLAAANALKAGASASIDEYDLKNDITQDKQSSIFELISNRYQKSGYPRLFKSAK